MAKKKANAQQELGAVPSVATETLPVTLLEAENVMRLRSFSASIPLTGALVIEGKNEQGKSSVLRLSDLLLAGAKRGEDPIHGDEPEGQVSGKVGPYTITRRFRRNGSATLTVTKEGEAAKLAAPQTLLNEFVDFIAVDPSRFAAMDAEQQLAVISRLVGFDPAPYDAKRKAAYDERTAVNRDRDRVAAELKGCGAAVEAPAAEVSVSALMAELEKIRAHNTIGDSLERNVMAAQGDAARSEAAVRALRRQLDDAEAKLAQDRADEVEALTKLAEFDPVDEGPLRNQIATAEGVNAAVRANARRAKLVTEHAEHAAESEKLTSTIDEIDAAKAKARKDAAAVLQIPGLDITDTGIVYNGKPFSQAGRSATGRISAAVAIASAKDKPVKLLTIDEAQQYDDDNLRAIVEQANAAGFQVLVARNGKGGEPGTITIEDGVIAE